MKPVVRCVCLFPNPDKPAAKKAAVRLKSWFGKRKIQVLPLRRLKECDAVITLGGDGTILAIAPRAAEAGVPVLGVNLGRLGFMTAVESARLNAGLTAWLSGRWTMSQRLMLEVTAPRLKSPLLALNDVVVRTGMTSRVTTISASIADERLGLFVGDGVIVATPTGSTAYSLAAQGPVIHPEVEALILTPICAHSFRQRPVVFPARQTLELGMEDQRRGNELQLCLDGQRVYLLKTGDRISIKQAPYKLQLLHDPKVSYFRILREKLSWGGR